MYCLKAQSAKNRSNLARFTTKNLLLPLLLPRIAVEIVHVKTLITVCLFRLSSPPKKNNNIIAHQHATWPRGREQLSAAFRRTARPGLDRRGAGAAGRPEPAAGAGGRREGARKSTTVGGAPVRGHPAGDTTRGARQLHHQQLMKPR